MTELRILLATPHAGYEQRVRQAFGATLNGDLRRWDVAHGEVTPDGLLQQLANSSPDVVAIGPDLETDDALALARELEQTRPEISVLLVSEPTPELWQHALRAGVRDVVAPDAVDADLRTAFERTMEVAARRRHNLVGDTDGPGSAGRIISVLSPKGGSGKTTVSSNLAVGLAMAEPNQVAIVDLDLQFGDVAASLGLSPQHTLVDAVRAPGELDGMALKSFLSSHHSDLWALCGPESPAEGEDVTADQAKQVVEKLADEFRYVVVDTGAGLDEHTLSAVEASTDLVLVCAMDVTSVRSLRKEIAALDQLGMTHQRRHLVINRADSKVGLDLRDVEASIDMPVDVAVSSSRAVPLSLNQGLPVIASETRSQVARQFAQLVERFAEQPAAVPGARRRKWGQR
ncbi:MAG: MinD/ParA family protein [Nitriliruptor sp.]|nr:MAG: MinD/ParA family protein [Nitriliruptor sp.]